MNLVLNIPTTITRWSYHIRIYSGTHIWILSGRAYTVLQLRGLIFLLWYHCFTIHCFIIHCFSVLVMCFLLVSAVFHRELWVNDTRDLCCYTYVCTQCQRANVNVAWYGIKYGNGFQRHWWACMWFHRFILFFRVAYFRKMSLTPNPNPIPIPYPTRSNVVRKNSGSNIVQKIVWHLFFIVYAHLTEPTVRVEICGSRGR